MSIVKAVFERIVRSLHELLLWVMPTEEE